MRDALPDHTDQRPAGPGWWAFGPALGPLLLSAALVLAPARGQSQAADVGGEAARSAATAWLQTLDAGRYAQTWTDAAAMFQKGVPAATWETAVRAVREPVGALQSRTESSAQATPSLPGVPDGTYLVLTYRSSFANKAFAVETIAAVLEADGRWKVAGYFLK